SARAGGPPKSTPRPPRPTTPSTSRPTAPDTADAPPPLALARFARHLAGHVRKPAARRDHTRHALPAELLAGVVYEDDARSAGGSRRPSRTAAGGGRQGRRDA